MVTVKKLKPETWMSVTPHVTEIGLVGRTATQNFIARSFSSFAAPSYCNEATYNLNAIDPRVLYLISYIYLQIKRMWNEQTNWR
jgi:hypothetical protein